MGDDRLKELVNIAENNILQIFEDSNKMESYLDRLLLNPDITYYAASMIDGAASVLDTYDGWKSRGYNVNSGEHGISVFNKRKQIKRKFIDESGRVRELSSANFVEKQKIKNGDLKLSSDLNSYYVVEHLFSQDQTTAKNVDLHIDIPASNLNYENMKTLVENSVNDILDGDDFVLPNSVMQYTSVLATYLMCLKDNVSMNKQELFDRTIKNISDLDKLGLSDKKLVLNSVTKVVRSEHTLELINEFKKELAEQRIVIDNYECIKVSEWSNDSKTEKYLLGQSVDDSDFFYVNVNDSHEGFAGSYNYEFDHLPTKKEAEDVHLNNIAAIDIDNHDQDPLGQYWQYGTTEDIENDVPDESIDKQADKKETSNKKIEDFGKKIGGARKDLWKDRGLSVNDLTDMNIPEKTKFVTKNNVFKVPDYQELVNNGLPVRVAYFIKKVRDALPTKPTFTEIEVSDEVLLNEKMEGYVEFISGFKDALMNVKTDDDILSFYDKTIKNVYVKNESTYRVVPTELSHGCMTNKLLKACQVSRFGLTKYDREIEKKQFCYSEEDKKLAGFKVVKFDDSCKIEDDNGRTVVAVNEGAASYFYYPDNKDADYANPSNWEKDTYFITFKHSVLGNNYTSDQAKEAVNKIADAKWELENKMTKDTEKKKRKTRFVPKQLQNVVRDGPCYGIDENNHATGDMYLNTFGFAGGEFGNWMNENDRQFSLDYGYNALMDLADALDIKYTDISFDGELSIAFGARGHSAALAHYEPLRQVINLTKMKGAGTLAHEWGHALDNILSKKLSDSNFDSYLTNGNGKALSSVKELMNTIKYCDVSDSYRKERWQLKLDKRKDDFISVIDSVLNDNGKQFLDEHDSEVNDFLQDKSMDFDKISAIYDSLSNEFKELHGYEIRENYFELFVDSFIAYYNIYNMDYKDMALSLDRTEFYKNSELCDCYYSKESMGYWASDKEMFARAFSCYVEDKLAERSWRSDYLCGLSDSAVFMHNGEIKKAFPDGEERKAINKCFDKVFDQLKELGLLHSQDLVPVKRKSR